MVYNHISMYILILHCSTYTYIISKAASVQLHHTNARLVLHSFSSVFFFYSLFLSIIFIFIELNIGNDVEKTKMLHNIWATNRNSMWKTNVKRPSKQCTSTFFSLFHWENIDLNTKESDKKRHQLNLRIGEKHTKKKEIMSVKH